MVMEDSLTKARAITYDRFLFFTSKRQKRESVESVYERLIEKTKICSVGDEETTLVLETFTLNMLDYDLQMELLKETVKPTKGLKKPPI